MSNSVSAEIGDITWADLTVQNAEEIKNFYKDVIGWHSEAVDMGGYSDFSMVTANRHQSVAGICHAKGINENLPAQWLIYINVKNVDDSAKRCVEQGGKIISEPKGMGGYGRYCIIQDPAGAVTALFEPAQ